MGKKKRLEKSIEINGALSHQRNHSMKEPRRSGSSEYLKHQQRKDKLLKLKERGWKDESCKLR